MQMNRSDLLLRKRNAPEQRQKRGCRGSTELPIVVPRRSWREISCGKLGTLIQQTKNSLNFVSTCLKVVDTRRISTRTARSFGGPWLLQVAPTCVLYNKAKICKQSLDFIGGQDIWRGATFSALPDPLNCVTVAKVVTTSVIEQQAHHISYFAARSWSPVQRLQPRLNFHSSNF